LTFTRKNRNQEIDLQFRSKASLSALDHRSSWNAGKGKGSRFTQVKLKFCPKVVYKEKKLILATYGRTVRGHVADCLPPKSFVQGKKNSFPTNIIEELLAADGPFLETRFFLHFLEIESRFSYFKIFFP